MFDNTDNVSWFTRFKASAPSLKFVSLLCIFIAVWGIIYNLKFHYAVGVTILSGHYHAVFVAVVLVLVYFTFPATKNMAPLRWFDYILALLSLGPCAYYGINYESLVFRGGMSLSTNEIILGTILVVVVLEAVRRTTGWAMVIVGVFFIFHALYAIHFPSFLIGPSHSYSTVITTVYLSPDGMMGFIMEVVASYIIAFATFGAFLIALGAGDKFVILAQSLVGKVRGGAAKISIVSSSLLGTLTGDPISNVGISGSFSLPLMRKMNFSREYAAAVETTSSVGGVIMPPMMGAIIFIMVEISGFPYVAIMKASVVPAILYFLAIYMQIDFYSKRHRLYGFPASELPGKLEAVKECKFLFVIFALLVYFLAGMSLFPVRAAYYTLGCMLVLFFFDRRTTVSLDKIIDALERSGKFVIRVTPLIAAAGIVFASLSLTGTGARVASRLVAFCGDSLFRSPSSWILYYCWKTQPQPVLYSGRSFQ